MTIIAYLLYFYFSRTLLPSASSGTTIGRMSFTHLLTSAISLYHSGTSYSQRFCGLPLGRLPTGWINKSALLWGAVDAILLKCDHHLILYMCAVCSACYMFPRHLISSFLVLSIFVSPGAVWHTSSQIANFPKYLLGVWDSSNREHDFWHHKQQSGCIRALNRPCNTEGHPCCRIFCDKWFVLVITSEINWTNNSQLESYLRALQPT